MKFKFTLFGVLFFVTLAQATTPEMPESNISVGGQHSQCDFMYEFIRKSNLTNITSFEELRKEFPGATDDECLCVLELIKKDFANNN